MIWEFAAVPQPRLLEWHGELRSLADLYAERARNDGREASAVAYTLRLPPLGLQAACFTARKIARPQYKTATFAMDSNLMTRSGNLLPVYGASGQFLIEPSQDVLLYSPTTLREMMDIRRKFDTASIRNLALSLDGKDLVRPGLESFDNYLLLALSAFPNLDSLNVVLGRTRFADPQFTDAQLVEIDTRDASTFADAVKHCGLDTAEYMLDWARQLKKAHQLWINHRPGPWRLASTTPSHKLKFKFTISFMVRRPTLSDYPGLWFIENWQWTTPDQEKTVGHKDYGNLRQGKWVCMPIARDVPDFRKTDGSTMLKLFNQ